MFAKVFQQILDSSLAEDYKARHVFEDMLKLCDLHGVVDMTREAIARRTKVPLPIVRDAIELLEKPDPQSRNPDHEGRRIVRLDDHRDWGWLIVNYQYYRDLAREDQRRSRTLERVRKFRDKGNSNAPVTPCNALKRHNAHAEAEADVNLTTKATKPTKILAGWWQLATRFEEALGDGWVNDAGKWVNRIKENPEKCERVVAEVENAIKESRIKTTPAAFAQYTWDDFK